MGVNRAKATLQLEALAIAAGQTTLVADATLEVASGEVVALVGASGSGKSLTARAALGLLPFHPGQVGGKVLVDGRECQTEADFQAVRGSVLGLIPQDTRASLDPLWRVGRQVSESARLAGLPPDPLPWLHRAGLPDPAVAALYPHTLSGGMAQRVVIAMALARQSRILVADECTTGLDPGLQRAILAELRRLAREGLGVLFITHDLRLLPGFADRVVVMEAGRTVETAARVGELSGAGRTLYEATRRIAGGVL